MMPLNCKEQPDSVRCWTIYWTCRYLNLFLNICLLSFQEDDRDSWRRAVSRPTRPVTGDSQGGPRGSRAVPSGSRGLSSVLEGSRDSSPPLVEPRGVTSPLEGCRDVSSAVSRGHGARDSSEVELEGGWRGIEVGWRGIEGGWRGLLVSREFLCWSRNRSLQSI